MAFFSLFSLVILCIVPNESMLLNNLVELNETFYKHSHIPEDGRLDFPRLAVKYNRSYEEHDVITEDQYILKVFRIPPVNKPKGLPILLLHGILDTADTFIIRGNNSLAYNLSGENYDIWVGNIRGNKYGRRHVTLDPDDDKVFWQYSFDENGYYDYATIIDYILDKTKESKVNVIGHSQGTTGIFILCSTRPEYNDKVNLHIAMAPITYLQNLRGGIVPLTYIGLGVIAGLEADGIVELLNENSTLRRLVQDFCTQRTGYEVCADGVVFPVAGSDPEEVEPAYFPIPLGHYLDGTSRQNVNHYLQTIFERRFAKYDYGATENLKKYKSVIPPLFDLNKITSQVVLMVGKNDFLGTVADAILLKNSLPKVEYFEMPRSKFNHIDFVWGLHMPTNLFPYIHNMINKYAP